MTLDDGSGDGTASPASAPTPEETPWLRAALSAARPEGSVARVDPIDAGGRRSTLVVRFTDGNPIVIRHGADRRAIETEATLLAAVAAETTVPVPTSVGWGPPAGELAGSDAPAAPAGVNEPEDDGDGDGGGWLATQFVDGDDLHERFVACSPAARRDLAAAFGRFLGELHVAFRFDGYGPIVADDGTLRAARRSPFGDPGSSHDPAASGPPLDLDALHESDRAAAWRDWLVHRGRESLDRLPAALDGVADAARERLDTWTVEAAPTPRLFPWDFRPGNALVANGEIVAIVDWEAPLAAGAALSVAKTEYLLADWYVPDEADALRCAFRTGYAEARPVPTIKDIHRIVAIAETAVDSHGVVTTPRYPPVDREKARRFHRRHLDDAT